MLQIVDVPDSILGQQSGLSLLTFFVIFGISFKKMSIYCLKLVMTFYNNLTVIHCLDKLRNTGADSKMSSVNATCFGPISRKYSIACTPVFWFVVF